jgi:tol-pal system protein YbgF
MIMLVRTGIFSFLPLFIVVASVSGAAAQDSSIVGELERLRRDMNTLQSYVFRNGNPTPVTAGVELPEFASQDSVSQLQLKIQEMRRRMRNMNGQFEEIQFKIGRTAERFDRLVADVDLRLRALEEGRPSVGSEQSVSAPLRAGQNAALAGVTPPSMTVISSETETSPGRGKELKPGQQSFGVISKNDLTRFKEAGTVTPSSKAPPQPNRNARTLAPVNQPIDQLTAAPRPAPVTTAIKPWVANKGQLATLPAGTPKAQYDYAYGLLMKRDLPKAEAALKAFIANHPKHELADNATFWLGETYYTRKNFQEAIQVYYEAYKKYPKGNKAPAVLLKLGMSLATIGEKESACSAYDELAKSHPKASPRILGNASRARKSLGCG